MSRTVSLAPHREARRLFKRKPLLIGLFAACPLVLGQSSAEGWKRDWHLRFPLPDKTAYSVTITSVFDHSMSRGPYQGDEVVTAYTGERGQTDPVEVWRGLSKYRHLNGFPFFVNGQYDESDRLAYDGHPGYDYSTGGQKIPVLAAAEGKVIQAGTCPEGPGCVKIDHGNGYQTVYLHMEQLHALGDVKAGDQIGIASKVDTKDIHLHFEVLRGGVLVDPYGWQGQYPDPWKEPSENLWKPRAEAAREVRWHPDGALITDGTTYWVLEGGRKHGIPNEDTFFAYGYDFSNGILVSEDELRCLPDGPNLDPPPNPRLVKAGTTIYELRSAPGGGQFKRAFGSESAFQGQGFQWDRRLEQEGSVEGIPDDPFVPVYRSAFRDGTLMLDKGTVYVISNSKKTPFQTGSAFLALGYRFDQVIPADLSPGTRTAFDAISLSGEIISDGVVSACRAGGGPMVSADLTISPREPYVVGKALTASFSITNRGTEKVTFATLTVGGRVDGACPGECPDFTRVSQITLEPERSYRYTGTLQPARPGTYNFFVAYQLTDGSWNTSVPADPGVINSLNIVVRESATGPTGVSIRSGGIVNTASQQFGPVAPGEMVTVFGAGLGPQSGVSERRDSLGRVATFLADTRLYFDDLPAPLLYVQANQINAVAPFGIAGKQRVLVRAVYRGLPSNDVDLAVVPSAPGVFTVSGGGTGPGSILNRDGSLNTASNPAAIGSAITIYATGGGETQPASVDGEVVGDSPPRLRQSASVTISGVPVPVSFAGGAPRSVAGMVAIQAVVPGSAPIGTSVPVVVTIGQRPSQAGVTMAVREAGPLAVTTLQVPGRADIALAGAPEGRQIGRDTSPVNAPVEVPLAVSADQVVRIEASGFVDVDGRQSPDTPPDGGNYSYSTERAFGVSSIRGPYGALIGIFLGPGPPEANLLPPDLDFRGWAQDLVVLRPKLQQPFFIGRGETTSGDRKSFAVPPGATRLFLGVLDQGGYNNDNIGFFSVRVSLVPGPAPVLYPRVYGLFDIALAGAPDGRQIGGDSSPLHSPVEAPFVMAPGQVVQIEASGFVDVDGKRSPDTAPDGRTCSYCLSTGRASGISSITGPFGALIGVFLGPGPPEANALPPDLDFRGGARDLIVLRPRLQQPFFVGRGRTSSGEKKNYVVPANATRLLLGVLDSGGYNHDNSGFFTAKVETAPGPAPLLYPRVYGLSNITLAGAPEGRQIGDDSSPLHSPVEVPFAIAPGQVVQVEASGFVDDRGERSPDTGPDGRAWEYAYATETERAFGISRIRGMPGGLIGVFLGPGPPDLNALPPDTDFSTASARDQATLRPLLQQPFFMGRGQTSYGEAKKFIAPPGATRLFLGVLDAGGYNYDNTGFFTVRVR